MPSKAGDGNLGRREQERDTVKSQLEGAREQIAALEPEITRLRQEQERLTNELAGFGAGTQAQMQELVTRLADHRKAADADDDQLRAILSEDLALAIAGRDLRASTSDQLRREQVREDWLSGRDQGNKGLDRFLQSLGSAVGVIAPPLTDGQHDTLLECVRKTWDALWHPPPDDAAAVARHGYLRGVDRQRVREVLAQAERLGSTSILQLLDDIAAHRAAIARLQEELSRTQGIGPELDAKRGTLKETSKTLDKANRDIGALRNQETGFAGRLDTLNKDIARLTAQLDQRQPEVRRASRALKSAAMIDELIKEAVPGQIGAVADAMTVAFREMAHKTGLVKNIDITEGCEVRLLTQKGRDLRDFDLSAGEKQVFTQSLISAIASVSGRAFPLIVDTPVPTDRAC